MKSVNPFAMKIKKRTLVTLFAIAIVLSFFVTPLGYYAKLYANRALADSPNFIQAEDRREIPEYQWRLKDENWEIFNFEKARGKVVFVHFWHSWEMPSEAELEGIQALYERFSRQIVFYIITDEEREPVEAFMKKNGYTFPVTYYIIGTVSPFTFKVNDSYLIDKKGRIAIEQHGIADWNDKQLFIEIANMLKEE